MLIAAIHSHIGAVGSIERASCHSSWVALWPFRRGGCGSQRTRKGNGRAERDDFWVQILKKEKTYYWEGDPQPTNGGWSLFDPLIVRLTHWLANLSIEPRNSAKRSGKFEWDRIASQWQPRSNFCLAGRHPNQRNYRFPSSLVRKSSNLFT